MGKTSLWFKCVIRDISEKDPRSLSRSSGIVCIADDVVIHGRGKEEHDRYLKGFMARCRELRVKSKAEKKDTRQFFEEGHRFYMVNYTRNSFQRSQGSSEQSNCAESL